MPKKRKKKGKKKKGKKKKEWAPEQYKIPEYKTPAQAAPKIHLTVQLADPPNQLFSTLHPSYILIPYLRVC